ncbi:MAG: hypothetical protein ABF649_12155 [Bacillus sp. (in: firmicutes)]
MILYILALFSLLLVIPIMYLLPLDLSNRGKVLIVGLALFTAISGIAAENILQSWQSILLMLLCVIIITYFLMKKSPNLLFISNQEEEEMGDIQEEFSFAQEKKDDGKSNKPNEENSVLLQEDYIEEADMSHESEIAINETIKLESIEEDLSEKIVVEAEEEEGYWLLDTEGSELHEKEPVTEKNEETALNYMEEIESMMEQGDSWNAAAASQEQGGKSNTNNHPSEQEESALPFEVDESLLEEIERPNIMEKSPSIQQEEEESNLLSVEDLIEEIHDLQEELLVEEQMEIIETENTSTEELELDIVEFDAENSKSEEKIDFYDEKLEEINNQFEEKESEEQDIDIPFDNSYEVEGNESPSLKEEEKPVVNELSNKVIDNTMMQLTIMKKMVSKEEYETAVFYCLNETIGLQAYFAFASLLIEQYVHYKEKEKLANLLDMLKDKFHSEPILMEQLLFMEQSYLHN